MYWSAAMPLADLTNYQPAADGKAGVATTTTMTAGAGRVLLVPTVRRHDPYASKCLDDAHMHDVPFAATLAQPHDGYDDEEDEDMYGSGDACAYAAAPTHALPAQQPSAAAAAAAHAGCVAAVLPPAVLRVLPAQQDIYHDVDDAAPPAPPGRAVCCALVQFKCHQAEYASCMLLDKGQYVVVQGDRGIDIGAVIRVNTPGKRTYVEKTGVTGSVLRYATQREVDYWAADLKQAEAVACAFCRMLVQRMQLDMDVVQCEYQFDKKKLTFYYEARQRVDFVQLLHDLYREFGCRIWMEKVRARGD